MIFKSTPKQNTKNKIKSIKIAKEKKRNNRAVFFNAQPRHVAFILDGNGRWAKKRGMVRMFGHKMGAKRVVDIVRECQNIGIGAVSLYALSCENLKRDRQEVQGLFCLFEQYLEEYKQKIVSNNYRFVVSGDVSVFPEKIQQLVSDLCQSTASNDGMFLNLCINYGSKQEILRAINLIIERKMTNISCEDLQNCLYTKDLPPLDLVVRTGREVRLSNFMLWQCAYSELYFCKTFWPDFNVNKLHRALKNFKKRERKFGLVPK